VFRLLGLLGGLSTATDLGAGAPVEESLKRALVAARLARTVGCPDEQVRDVLYTALLQHLGCTAFSHENAAVWGDDVSAVRLSFLTDFTAPTDVWRTWVTGMATATGTSRPRVLATTLTSARRLEEQGMTATCEVARDASRQLGLPGTVQDDLAHVLAMWDGGGHPAVQGDAIPLATRIVHVASVAVLFLLQAGPEAAVAQVRHRSGTYLDPELVEVFLPRSGELLDALEDVDAFGDLLDCEPDPVRFVDDTQVEAVARTFGNLVDLKSPWLHGHSTAVADLASGAAVAVALDEHASELRVTGHLHDVGRVGVSSRIWDKATLTRTERDQAGCTPTTASGSWAASPSWQASHAWPGSTTNAATAAATTAG
jgi:hypothetical protein